ncbi:uncharacterized protein LOC142177552 [Nicotiana tabacum]|uniref:Uncharacterized protein LOC142177552 n=1 Tax=Nicotiana tabacum TaxID=4097 RepID=A0AC58TZU0_TOBAC
MEEEAKSFVVKCDKCQRYGSNMHRPAELLHPVIAPWPFMKWGMDIVGPLPQAKGQLANQKDNVYTIPSGNGKAESTNKVIINNLKNRLQESKGNWPEVLLGVLWAYHTTTKTSTGETPFSLVYGTEALIPVQIGEPSTWFEQAMEESNSEEMQVNLDLLEGRREAAANSGKLSPTWEGPYRVRDIAGKGAYELETMDGKILPSHWNVVYLKRYYF